ncbi:TIGR01212 family radical SAM protein [Geomonas sp. RF6]|uniref:TIGR01212 family radical SAM protein n=1 Tax=Geomonas sp. RF6 TaxID=2897342 RepID=UPI001E4FF33D|nr:TIGR01212 family radical SAM protein [Geomonas sp. RF6]UFS70676.1 TIGR01212 family radical SAM protein [Geomonas sp. RF6]
MTHELVHHDLRINSYGSYLRRRFGCRVSKVNVDAGFTCPNRDGSKGSGGCIYCDNASFSPAATQSVVSLERQIEEGISYHRRRLGSEKFIVYFQKFTNTYASIDKLRDVYYRALARPDVLGISVGTRPDALSDDALLLLKEIARTHYVCVEIGLQSIEEATLKWMNRGHSFSDYLKTVERLAAADLDVCTHLIYGSPGDTPATLRKTAELLGTLPVNSVKVHQLHVVRGTRLEQLYRAGQVPLLTVAEYIGGICDFLELIPEHLSIQRLYGSAPLDLLVAPAWGLKNNSMWYAIVNELKRRGTWQGCRFDSATLRVSNL